MPSCHRTIDLIWERPLHLKRVSSNGKHDRTDFVLPYTVRYTVIKLRTIRLINIISPLNLLIMRVSVNYLLLSYELSSLQG